MKAAKCHYIPPDREEWGCVPLEELKNAGLLVTAANEKETLLEVSAQTHVFEGGERWMSECTITWVFAF